MKSFKKIENFHASNLRKILDLHCIDFENYDEWGIEKQLNELYFLVDLLEVINTAFPFFIFQSSFLLFLTYFLNT